MGYPTYDSYQETKIPWLPKYPSNWEVRRLKFMSSIQNGIDYKHVEVNQSEEGYPVYGSGGVFRKASSYLYDGESVLYGRKGTIDKPLYVTGAFWTVDTMFYSEISESVFGKYMFYSALTTQFQYLATQTALPSITQNDLSNYWLCFPSYSEQTKIAHFLDYKTNQVDRLIDKKKALIEKLNEQRIAVITQAVTKGINPDVPMKDSEIEWLGEVPKHWDVLKLRFLGECQNGINIGAQYFGRGYPFVSYGDVYNNRQLPRKVEGLVESSETDRKLFSVQTGDVLFTRTSETIEEIAMTSVCMSSIKDSVFAGFLIRFRPHQDGLVKEFSEYYFQNVLLRAFFVKEMNLVTRASLSQELLKNLPVLLPPQDEQKAIADYLEGVINKIDGMVTLNQQTIEKMEEYRAALITAAVTGKIDVRDVEVPRKDISNGS